MSVQFQHFIIGLSTVVMIVLAWCLTPLFAEMRLHPFGIAYRKWRGRESYPEPKLTSDDLPPLEALDRQIRTLASVINAPEGLLPKHRGVDFGHAMIEYDGRFHYLFVERGERYDEQVTDSIDDVMYWTFCTITRAMAGEYELIHRDPYAGDIRRLLFRYQLQLLTRLNPAWAERRRAELDELLLRHPYNDRLDM